MLIYCILKAYAQFIESFNPIYPSSGIALYGPSVGSGHPFNNWGTFPHGGDFGIIGHLSEHDSLQSDKRSPDVSRHN